LGASSFEQEHEQEHEHEQEQERTDFAADSSYSQTVPFSAAA